MHDLKALIRECHQKTIYVTAATTTSYTTSTGIGTGKEKKQPEAKILGDSLLKKCNIFHPENAKKTKKTLEFR